MALWSSEASTESSYNGVLGIGLHRPETWQEVTEAVREAWMWESGKDECVRTDAGPEAAYWPGKEFSRMGGYDFPGRTNSSKRWI